MKPIIFWGASGQAKVLHEFIESMGYRLIALFDNHKGLPSPVKGVPIYYGEDSFHEWKTLHDLQNTSFLVTIGGERGRDRLEIQEFLISNGLTAFTAVHPSAYVANNARIGAGSQILINAAVGAEAILKDACIVNTSASVDHECLLGQGVHIAPGACLAGCVTVGDFTLVGAGATVLPRIVIGANAIIGAGTVVTKNIPDNAIAIGNPAKITEKN